MNKPLNTRLWQIVVEMPLWQYVVYHFIAIAVLTYGLLTLGEAAWIEYKQYRAAQMIEECVSIQQVVCNIGDDTTVLIDYELDEI